MCFLLPLAFRAQAITNGPDGFDLFTNRAKLFTQSQHGIIYRAIPANIALSPDGVQEIGPAEGSPRAFQQQMKQRKLGWAKVQRLSIQHRQMGLWVQAQRP